jgi:hypothetical protein
LASYQDHVTQAGKNLDFLVGINTNCRPFIDWQVTTCFYVGVHLINAFLAKEADLHFGSHQKVQDAISPDSSIAKTRLDNDTYLAYKKLRNLSRRARYLCNHENTSAKPEIASYIFEKHFLHAFTNLDKLIKFFYAKYGHAFNASTITYKFTMATPNCIYFKFAKEAAEVV